MSIDFILPWVDSSDKEWKKSFLMNHPSTDSSIDFSEKRYRDNGLLKYWFRSVEKYAPWVNKIFFVTCGQIPEWLDTTNPKLVLINHKDYIPQDKLPVFSSHPIELYMHKIPGLSENFVYFNDDIFINSSITPEDFFVNGIAKDYAVMNALSVSSIGHILFNNILQINKNFDKKIVLKENFFKWFSFKYSTGLIRNILLKPWPHFTGFVDPHCAMPYTKSLLDEVWQNCQEVLELSSSHKFRSNEDVNQFLFRYWRLCKGDFIPCNLEKLTFYYDIMNDEKTLIDVIKNHSVKQVIINDNDVENYDEKISKIREVFESEYSEKSSFEK